MIARTSLIALVVLLLSAATARADFTGHLGDMENGLNLRRAELADNPDAKKTVKEIDKLLKILAKPNTSLSYAKEVKAASKIAQSFQKKLVAENGLLPHLASALEAYREELSKARLVLAGLANTKQLTKQLTKADKALAKAAQATTWKKELVKLSAAAKFVGEYVGFAARPEATWIVKEFALATTGLDLDGDGSNDNSLANLASALKLFDINIDVQSILDDALGATTEVTLIQMWDVDDWNGDAEVFAGLMNGIDSDQDPSDNFSGQEYFDVTNVVGPDDRPVLRQSFALGAGGSYRASYTGEALQLGGFELPASAKFEIQGHASPLRNQGVIGIAIPQDVLLDALEAAGYDRTAMATAFAFVGAWDLFGGTAMSAAFTFEAVSANVLIR